MHDLVTICEDGARVGGAVLLDWQGRFGVQEKGPADLVTQADLASQEAIQEVVARAFPDHAFVGEETGSAARPEAEFCWIVDPLDGTTNYVHGYPFYCVSVAVESRGGVLAGAVFDPVSGECFTAARGEGARLDGKPISTSQVSTLSDALIAVSFPPKIGPETREIRDFVEIASACQAIRRTGSAALNLAFLAAGRVDGYWAHTIYPWDVAAGALLVREAGGLVTAIDGGPFDVWRPAFVASAGEPLHGEFRSYLGRGGG